MNLNTFCDTYQIQVNFLEIWRIRSAIENCIRRERIEMLEVPNMYYVYMLYNITEILKNKKGSKNIYAIFNKKDVHIKSQIKWNNTIEYTSWMVFGVEEGEVGADAAQRHLCVL